MRGQDRAKYLLLPCKEEYSFASVVTLQKEIESRNMARSIIFFGLIRISNRFGSVQFNNVNVERKNLDWTPYWYRPLAKKITKKRNAQITFWNKMSQICRILPKFRSICSEKYTATSFSGLWYY